MKKRFWKGKILLLSVALLLIGCMSAPMITRAASKKPGQVKKVTVKAVSCTSMKISWKSVKGAKGYRIYRAAGKNGKYKKIKTTKNTSYTNTKLNGGKRYYYKVCAYSGNKTGKYSAAKSGVTKTHSWKRAAATGHYNTKYVQVPFSQAKAPWDSDNIYRCLRDVSQKYNVVRSNEAALMKHMNEVSSPGWVEEVYKIHDFCTGCGIDLTANNISYEHVVYCEGGGGYASGRALDHKVEHRAVSQKVWVQDAKAYTYCTRCKTRK